MSARPVPKRKSDRKAWLIAWALALALHGAAIVGLRWLPLLEPTPTQAQEPEPVQLVFSRTGPEPRRTEQTHFFSELPPDRADAPPVKADFLSNITSRARDRVPGGDAALSRMEGEGDAPMVKLESNGATAQPPSAPPAAQPAGSATTPSAETRQGTDAGAQGPNRSIGAGSARASERNPGTPAPGDVAIREPEGDAGGSDIHQPEMANPDGNAALTGDVSLNTTAWDYAPWLQRFGRQLMHRWMAPPAYYMGLLKEGGWAVIEVEISRSGKLLRLERLEEHGHPSLIIAAESALRYLAPIEPLPPDFPEPTLILRIRMIYPKIRPR